ncbi:PAS/PAC sensor signal transduction histidine kinase [Halalkaliarchaeum desulfuricum]|uniref:PAS/PAC sensor signal transduction histidine kinase n=1 Tax=Halalkaliarchaeum desulfuricum TaxID=2055893 RepID=A0A343TIY3_9EURY|nr:PAS domain-containing hybrid sensor histidine kinase/response regulator [Halalkaliarchaeum desulfuricum]AUX09055.1 PAS/PAC sensor signal transduction histidine kinase [Halalkaliarchaeum desulfuricum]
MEHHMNTANEIDSRDRVLPLLSESGDRRLVTEWIEEHPSYEPVDLTGRLEDTAFDVCILDMAAFQEHLPALRAKKSAAAPVMLPYLLLLEESAPEVIDIDGGELADNVVTESIDEIVIMPIQQAELHWRLAALLRLREQSLALRRRKRNLKRQVDLFEKAQEIAHVGAWEYDLRTNEHSWTEEVYKIYDLPEERTLTAEESIEYYHPDDRDTIREAFWGAVEEGESYDVEVRLITAEGDQRWARTRGEPQHEDGEVVRVRGTIQDITDRKQREQRLQRQSRAIAEAPVGITISDPDQEDNPLIYANDAFAELTGYPREEILGENCRFLQGEDTDSARVAQIREAIDNEEPITIEIRNYRKDGTEFWNRLEIAPVSNDEGEVINFVGFQQDVTERRLRDQHLETISRVLRHNLRNDMNVIQGFAERIHAETSGEIAQSAVDIVEMSYGLLELADKERAITEVLLEDAVAKELSLKSVLQHVVSRVESDYPEATISVECREDVTVRAAARFEEALIELLENGIIHTDSDSPEVAITVIRSDGTTHIDIADTGPQIPEMEQNILEENVRQTSVYHGGGLGLWLVKLITTRSGGTITVHENIPTGNIVRITFHQ